PGITSSTSAGRSSGRFSSCSCSTVPWLAASAWPAMPSWSGVTTIPSRPGSPAPPACEQSNRKRSASALGERIGEQAGEQRAAHEERARARLQLACPAPRRMHPGPVEREARDVEQACPAFVAGIAQRLGGKEPARSRRAKRKRRKPPESPAPLHRPLKKHRGPLGAPMLILRGSGYRPPF